MIRMTSHLFLSDCSQLAVSTEELISRLPDGRREKTLAVRDPKTRRMSAFAGLLASYALRSYAVSPEKVVWEGKPHIENSLVHFNISHSAYTAAVLVSPFPCGVDIEKIRPITRETPIRKKLFSEEERLSFSGPEGFFRAWTAKEAYLKYTGQGFSLPMSHVHISGAFCEMGSAESDEFGRSDLLWPEIPGFSDAGMQICICQQTIPAFKPETIKPEMLL
ncbi:MAG: 4'-phosphopantetheinyl transferase superfamily protein [Clostridia bacterium]|nr:4'-phosphopantetheinyl transferase superfamily protein [Clostridia bacterium]